MQTKNRIVKTAAEEFFFSGVLRINTINLDLVPYFISTEEHTAVNRYVVGSRFLPAKLALGGFFYARKGGFENLFTKNAENA